MSVFNRDEADDFSRGARSLIVYPQIGAAGLSPELRLEEARGLALAIGLHVVETKHYRIRAPKAATLLGGGQLAEIAEQVKRDNIELLIVDGSLTAIQQRNLEERTGTKTIDRTGLILEIFGERAATAEGRLQVELAHLDYQAGRLVRSWTHLERQRGGFGFLGGPGETQIEADRRMIRDRMAKLRRELSEVKRTRSLHRDRRQRAPWPTIALVGYTNAGKSTVFNHLTLGDVMAQDMLFATLDPTMREIELPGIEKAILSDTVGFVSDLPTQLVAAFRATLEEVISADLILHVRDIGHPASEAQRRDVLSIMEQLLIARDDNVQDEGQKVIEIWNKIDQLPRESRDALDEIALRSDDIQMVSAQTGEGCDDLRELISAQLKRTNVEREIKLPVAAGAAIAWLHQKGEVRATKAQGEHILLSASLSPQSWGQFEKQFANDLAF